MDNIGESPGPAFEPGKKIEEDTESEPPSGNETRDEVNRVIELVHYNVLRTERVIKRLTSEVNCEAASAVSRAQAEPAEGLAQLRRMAQVTEDLAISCETREAWLIDQVHGSTIRRRARGGLF